MPYVAIRHRSYCLLMLRLIIKIDTFFALGYVMGVICMSFSGPPHKKVKYRLK